MDWTPSELQEAITELAPQLLADSDPWHALVEAEMLSLDELMDICSLLVAVGEAGARVPAFETLLLGEPLRRAGIDIGHGDVLTGALLEPAQRDPRCATTRVHGGKLTGRKLCVPALDRATWVVVPTQEGLWGVRPEDAEVELQVSTNGDVVGRLLLEDTPGVALPMEVSEWLARVQVGVCAVLYGLSRQALSMTAAYTTEREQFGRAIGTFQAVSQRAADAWIETWAMEVTLWQAAWQVSTGRDATRALAIARYTASEGAHRVTAAAQHLHGGMGFDRDYALHRYFLTVKHWEFVLGGASEQLERVGRLVARRHRL